MTPIGATINPKRSPQLFPVTADQIYNELSAISAVGPFLGALPIVEGCKVNVAGRTATA
jgi:hypothetical protein